MATWTGVLVGSQRPLAIPAFRSGSKSDLIRIKASRGERRADRRRYDQSARSNGTSISRCAYITTPVSPRPTLNAAREVAQRIFSAQGVKLHWLDCARNAAELPLYPACEQAGGGPSVLTLKILPHSMARQYSTARGVFGFALPTGKDGFAKYANVFFHRAEELAKRKAALGRNYYPSLPVILGHVMAHELGHLLLGYQHRPAGIMTADWKKRELAKMAQGKFGFTAREGERLRGAVTERERVEAARRAGSTSGH